MNHIEFEGCEFITVLLKQNVAVDQTAPSHVLLTSCSMGDDVCLEGQLRLDCVCKDCESPLMLSGACFSSISAMLESVGRGWQAAGQSLRDANHQASSFHLEPVWRWSRERCWDAYSMAKRAPVA